MFDNQKASLDKILAAQGLIFGGFEKLVDLNLKVMKATFEDMAQKSHEAVDVKDPQEAVAFTSSLMQPSADKVLAYGKHVYDIVSSVQAELSRLAEDQLTHSQQQVHEAIEQLAKNAPTGTEGAIALLKSSVASANSAYETVAKAAKQASEAAESNITAATNATFKAATEAAEVVKSATPRPAARSGKAA